jgi:hypothetical protein
MTVDVFTARADVGEVPCALPAEEIAGQGGLSVGALGLEPGALGLTPGALGLEPGALGLEPGALALTPGALGLEPGALGGNSNPALEALVQEILNNPASSQWLLRFLPAIQEDPTTFGAVTVAIIIVDDFEDAGAPTEALEHGELVERIYIDLINDAGLADVIEIHRVDITEGSDFVVNGPDGIADRIGQKVAELRDSGLTRFILSMSFGLIPCEDPDVPTSEGSKSWSLFDYIQAREQIFQSPEEIEVFLECVAYNPDGSYTAHFGYINPNDYPVIVPFDTPDNHLSGGGLNNAQRRARTPFYFGVPDNAEESGRSLPYPNSAFQVRFTAAALVWHFQGDQIHVNVNDESQSCASEDDYGDAEGGLTTQSGGGGSRISVFVECVAFNPLTERYIAHFGYENTNGEPIFVAHGRGNNITGGGLSNDQKGFRPPVLFGVPNIYDERPGRTSYYPTSAFQVEFDGSDLVWTLRGPDGRSRTTTANSTGSPACPDIPQANDYSIAEYLFDLYGSVADEMILALLTNPINDDANLNDLVPLLQGYLDESAGESDFALIPVAAAGNTRLYLEPNGEPYGDEPVPPLAPASFLQTIAVGATLGQSESPLAPLAIYAHDSNVVAPGAWYYFGDNLFGAGTSYSTPFVGAFAATFLTYEDPDTCDFTTDTEGVGRVPLIGDESVFDNVYFDSTSTTQPWPLKCDPSANAAPVAEDDAISTLYRTAVTISVLDNDTDDDEDTLTVIAVDDPANGTAVINEDSTITYTPDEGFPALGQLGTDTFDYTISDGDAEATATVTVTVARLQLTSLCPAGLFRVRNVFSEDIPFTWDVYNTSVSGSGVATANSDVQFNTGLASGTVRLFVNGIQNDVKATDNTCLPVVHSFTLINADNDLPIADFDPLETDAVLNLATLPTRRLNIRANTLPTVVGSVVFRLNGVVFRTETTAPYALAGDNSGDYLAWTPRVGTYELSATPYTGPNGTGTAGTPRTITFEVTDVRPNRAPDLRSPGTQYSVEGDTISLQLNVSDDGGPLTFAITGGALPEGLTLNTTTGLISGVIADGAASPTPYAITVQVMDNGGLTDSVTFDWVVSEEPTFAVTSFMLINAQTEQPIMEITDGMIIDLSDLGVRRLNIRAVTTPVDVGSVEFILNGRRFRIEEENPYALAGNRTTPLDYYNWSYRIGTYTLRAIPYSGTRATGAVGGDLEITFTIRE